MASKFDFKDVLFGINSEGIHLLRNRFPYKTIPMQDVESLSIAQGHEFRRWPLVLGLGGLLILGGIVYSIQVLRFVLFSSKRIYIEELAAMVLPLGFGALLLYLGFKMSLVLQVRANGKKHSFSLKEIEEEGRLEEFKGYLRKQFSWVELL